MSYTAAPSPKGTNYARLYVTTRAPARMAHDADVRNAGLDRGRRWSGRDDADPKADAMDALQGHLANCLGDEDLNTAQLLLEKLLETSGGEQSESEDSEASNDPEVQRKDPDNFAGQDRRGKRMAGDQRPQPPAGKLEKILAADTGRRR